MRVHKRYYVKKYASRKANVLDIFTGLPVVSNGRQMVNLAPEEASAIADLLNAMDEERLGKARDMVPPAPAIARPGTSTTGQRSPEQGRR